MKHRRHTARRRRLAAATAWCVAIAGFVVYLVNLGSIVDAYGGVGTGIVLLLWLTLFSVLFHVSPDMRARRPPLDHHPGDDKERVSRLPLAERVDRVVAPSAALRNSAAQGRMMSVLGPGAAGMSQREVDMMDWGFAFGVAWAVARNQDAVATDAVVSERALQATHAVYEAYRGSPAPIVEQSLPARRDGTSNGSGDASPAHTHTDRTRASDPAHVRRQH